MDSSQSFEAIDINPIADASLDDEEPQTCVTLNQISSSLPLPKNLEEFSTRGSRSLRSINDFLSCLDALKVPGPLMLFSYLDSKIGEGAQYTVYRNQQFVPPTSEHDMYTIPVAVKKPKFTLSASQRLDLSKKDVRKQVHDMHLEITALQHPALRSHRNVVNLLGYGVDDTWHQAPLLILELALADLEVFVGKGLEWPVKQQLCLDVGAGLDCLHASGIVHGDLKPKNVLVFENYDDRFGVPVIAKLADFGYSIDEAKNRMNGSIEITLWSPGWEAPEIRQHLQAGSPIRADKFLKADNYSFGLLVWSVMCLNGSKPLSVSGESATATALESVQATLEMPATLRLLLENVLPLVLAKNEERPLFIGDLLKDNSPGCQNWQLDCQLPERLQSPAESEMTRVDSQEFEHHWTIPDISPFLVEELGNSFKHHRDKLNAGQMFAMFLLQSFKDMSKLDVSLQISMLVESARSGHVPAQAVVKRVLDSYNVSPGAWVEQGELRAWLFNGASTGSYIAAEDLGALDVPLQSNAMQEFRDNGGYVQFYSPMGMLKSDWQIQVSSLCSIEQAEISTHIDSLGNRNIHYVATFGSVDDLASLLDESGASIDELNSLGETALYKASMRGCWRMVTELCRRGADASISGRPHGATCLHWLFNFPPDHIGEVASMLVTCGADPSALLNTSHPIVNYHFPFTWPPGSPLHWAVAASGREAALTLSKLGARMNLRNCFDPYVYDPLVRFLNLHGPDTEGDSSTLSTSCAGFSVVDLASSMRNWRMLDCLRLADNGTLDPTAIDEEGYTPFHRLHFNKVGRTSTGLRFSYAAFTGDPLARKESILQVIRSLSELGFDINKMTRPSHKHPSGEPGVNGLSPLMLAVANCDVDAVDGLLENGADPNLTNSDGYSALMRFTQDQRLSDFLTYRQRIVSSLLAHGANPNLVAADGMTALIDSARRGDVAVARLLIGAGAEMRHKLEGLSVPALLIKSCGYRQSLQFDSRETMESCQSREVELLTILQKWVLLAPNTGHIELMEDGDIGKGTLLHYAAGAGLFTCVSALLEAGAKVNAIGERSDTFWRRSCEETPLDVVEKERTRIVQDSETGLLPKQAAISILKCLQQIKDKLEECGGVTATEKQKS